MIQQNNGHVFITTFNPKIDGLDSASTTELSLFRAGNGFEVFDQYIYSQNGYSDARYDCENGTGTTHLIWNEIDENSRELVAYFSISASVIPYDDGIEDEEFSFSNYPSIPVLEIKMFAVSERYQDVFFRNEATELPISAWCINTIVGYANEFIANIAGIQALYLHAIPTAESFYLQNGFSYLPSNARPLFSVDQEYRAMWMPIRNVSFQN